MRKADTKRRAQSDWENSPPTSDPTPGLASAKRAVRLLPHDVYTNKTSSPRLYSVHSFLRYGAKTEFLNQSRVVTLLQICEKQQFTLLTLILSMMMCIQNLVLFCQFVLKILSKNQILTSIKGRNSVADLRKTKIYNTISDLVTDNVYANFGLILSIRSQDIEKKNKF